eukprot:3444627-Amphidinium_carterae.1
MSTNPARVCGPSLPFTQTNHYMRGETPPDKFPVPLLISPSANTSDYNHDSFLCGHCLSSCVPCHEFKIVALGYRRKPPS